MGKHVSIDYNVFAIANSKELLNQAAQLVYEKGYGFQPAPVLTFVSDESEQVWYAFECKKAYAVSFECISYALADSAIPGSFWDGWKGLLGECGELLGNNGVVFNMFYIHYPNFEDKPIAHYSGPNGVGTSWANSKPTVWYRDFDKSVKKGISEVGKILMPYEMFHTKTPRDVYYPEGADSSYDDLLEQRREKMALARAKKEELKKAGVKPDDSDVKKGFYQFGDPGPETVPLGAE